MTHFLRKEFKQPSLKQKDKLDFHAILIIEVTLRNIFRNLRRKEILGADIGFTQFRALGPLVTTVTCTNSQDI
jgi:hypothetical protein